ncbi:oligosaccharide flippase family protein [Altererythrobacter endophyticus]|uniref:Oligosaccharide flippase family protein n=1 Tax=Altericroceibacterium endophyticum TaxID=1808508 RepID=A0A6I4T4C2_9SPHN|nr:oligosaccharide flippase family protein [Altericroceibacterium endophyticum]
MAALAKGGRTNFLGFLLRLAARLPFLFIAGRLYGAESLGRFASALVIIELTSQLATLGQKRGLAQQLSRAEQPDAHIVADGMVLSMMTGAALTALLLVFPEPMFPSGQYTSIDLLLPLTIIPFALTDVSLAALAYRYDIGSTVKARSVVEPWAISIMAGIAFFLVPKSGLAVAYIVSIFAAALTAFIPLVRAYGLPRGWIPHPGRIGRLAIANLPLAAADAVEWGTRRLDIGLLGIFASPTAVGVYYVAQQVASLPQKLKTSFEPILGPVITRALKDKDYAAIAKQVCQVGFWITAAQAGIALALGIPGEGVMGLVGPNFVGGTGALAFLLAAEVVAATAVVSEAALVYVARMRNLWVSLGTIALQAVLTVGVMLLIDLYDFNQLYRAGGAAFSLMLALGIASLIKAWMLSRILDQRVNNWRWALVYAAIPAALVGWLATHLPEWAELLFGIPAILLTYGFVIWKKGFGPEDRVLFRKKVEAET